MSLSITYIFIIRSHQIFNATVVFSLWASTTVFCFAELPREKSAIRLGCWSSTKTIVYEIVEKTGPSSLGELLITSLKISEAKPLYGVKFVEPECSLWVHELQTQDGAKQELIAQDRMNLNRIIVSFV